MPTGDLSRGYYDDPDDFDAHDAYGADDEGYAPGGGYDDDHYAYNAYNEDDAYDAYDESNDYGEYADDDPYRERLEVAPDDADSSYEVFEEVYQKATARAEATLDRPRRRRKKAPPPPPPGPLRAFWLRRQRAVLRVALRAALGGLIVTAFIVLWQRAPADRFAAQAPSFAPPVVRCGGDTSAWPREVSIAGHTIPALIKNELSWAGERHGYQFHGAAGQVWRITVEARGESTLDPVIRLFDESGREVASADDRSAQDFAAELTFAVPQDGAYCVLVESSQGGVTTGVYWLSAWVVE